MKREEIKVLVIEDDKFLRELLVSKLKKEGYAALEAVDGEAGMEVAKKEEPHIILLDLVLPGTSGFEILSSLKNQAGTANIPIIVLSNLGSREDIDRALALGAKEFLIKAHHTPQEIIDAIRKVLDQSYLPK